jgi:hypothetical protein
MAAVQPQPWLWALITTTTTTTTTTNNNNNNNNNTIPCPVGYQFRPGHHQNETITKTLLKTLQNPYMFTSDKDLIPITYIDQTNTAYLQFTLRVEIKHHTEDGEVLEMKGLEIV